MFKTFLVFLLVLFLINGCNDGKIEFKTKREDNTLRDAVGLYFLRCTGGSLNACKSSCNGKCGTSQGANVTTDNLPCLNSCQSDCSTNCDLSFSILIYLARNPIKK